MNITTNKDHSLDISTLTFFPINHHQVNVIPSPRNVVANLLDSDIEVNEFELQSLHYVHFRTHAFGKGMESPIHP